MYPSGEIVTVTIFIAPCTRIAKGLTQGPK